MSTETHLHNLADFTRARRAAMQARNSRGQFTRASAPFGDFASPWATRTRTRDTRDTRTRTRTSRDES